jgi:hypothetical protein
MSPCKDVLFSALTEVQQTTEEHCSGAEEKHTCCKSTSQDAESEEEAPDKHCEDNCDCYCCAHPVFPALNRFSRTDVSQSISQTIQEPTTPPVRDFSYLIWRPPQPA